MISIFLATLINFSWLAPTTGPTPDGFKLLVGNAAGVYTQVIDVGNNIATQQDIDLDSGPKYFAVVSYNQWGDSAESNEVLAGKSEAPTVLIAAP